jgi:hypothetical protein
MEILWNRWINRHRPHDAAIGSSSSSARASRQAPLSAAQEEDRRDVRGFHHHGRRKLSAMAASVKFSSLVVRLPTRVVDCYGRAPKHIGRIRQGEEQCANFGTQSFAYR